MILICRVNYAHLYNAPAQARILIVDDNPDMRGLLCDMIAPSGYELQEAENGEEAIALFERWSPDIILMDMRMPVMDGYETIRRIKATEKGSRTVIIAETAAAFEEDMKAAFTAGADGYICKPFELDMVLDTLRTFLLRKQS